MTDNQKKILANLIKADLKDVLNNDNRWKVVGTEHYFQNYIDAGDQIWVYSDNEKIKKALDENRLANSEWRNSKRYWNSYKVSEEEEIKLENIIVWQHELEPADWQEIVSLIQQVREMKEQKDKESIAEVDRKLRSQKGLVYWPHCEKRMSSMDEEGRLWYLFKTMENGKNTWIYVPKNHSALVNFPFEKAGFYLITGVDHIPTSVDTKHRGWKNVSLQDNITITPFEVEEAPNTPNEKEKPINKPSDNSGKKSADNFAPLEKNFLRQYFQKHGIKKISLKNNELIITHNNNNEIITNDQLPNNAELLLIKDSLEKVDKSELTSQELNINSNNNSTPTQPKNNNAVYWVCGIGGALIIGSWLLILLLKSKKLKNK